MISKFFIDRPVLANVLAIVMVLIGGVALFTLPVAQYPNIVPPTVSVTTSYPGASADTVMNTVALPIEQQVNGVQGMIYMQSTSAADGTYSLTVTFDIGTDLNFAQVLVQNRVSAAMASLPQAVQVQGVTVQQKSTSILQIVTLTSPDGRYDSLFLSNYATISLVPELSRIPGVGNVSVFGVGQYSMRIWLDPEKLQARALAPADVIKAIQQQSQQVTSGQVGAPPAPAGQNFQFTVNVEGRLTDPVEFANIIVKVDSANGGQITRVRDVGRVELGAQSYSQSSRLNGKPAAGIGIFQLPTANALNVAALVNAKMAELAKSFPQGLTYRVPFDTTRFVNASIHEVYKTLIEAAVLVLIVILVFLQDWRATLVPATTVPVTIIGAFAAMAALGFTVNLSTLFAIILSIGIVVDDAIVVVEGAAHHIEQGLSPHDAAIKAMDELFGPIVGITLVLMAVFIPAAFLPGLTGQMYAQFALVIAATAFISAINAATLKPTQCAMWLRLPVPPEKRNFFFRGFNRVYQPIENAYARLIGVMARNSGAMVLIAMVIASVGVWGIARLPTSFIPVEDQGYVMVAAQLPNGAAAGRTQQVMDQVTKAALAVAGVDQVISISGISVLDNSATLANAGVAYVILKDWSLRKPGSGADLRSVVGNLQRELDKLQDAVALVLVPPPIQGIGNASGFTMQVELRDGSFDYTKLQTMAQTIVKDGNTQTGLQRLNSTFRSKVPQVQVLVDRIKAETLNVSVGDVFSVLAGYVGSSYVNQFNKFGRTFQVYVQADSKFRLLPSDIEKLYVRSQDNKMVPLGALVQIRPTVGPALVGLYNLYPTASIVGGPAQGFSSGEAMNLMEQIADRTLPRGTGFEWTAMSYQEKIVGSQIFYVFGLGMLLVYLCLAGQYESWTAPISVILAVPLSLMGPVIALTSLGLSNNLYTQIGLVLLIALSAKNAILIVEVARERRMLHGDTVLQAAVGASRARFRPIIMTSFAFILGVVPLVTSTGAGASARVSLGLAVLSGMLASTLLAVLFVPSFFVVMQHFEEWRKSTKQPAVTHETV
jgi:hydrophobic/amphiphilic exporter-1 (mainly G- bacteria), HAE1 family